MAGNIPAGSMSTTVKLNGSESVKTLRELKQAVTQATSAWKAQRAELSSVGKSTEAAESKYKGLGEAIKKQKEFISGLQQAQKHLAEAQKSVDRSTEKGRQEYGKYNEALQKNETRIHSAEQKLSSLTNQQSKARKSLSYYKSGLAEAQKQLKLNESVTRSYINRLSSEGKGYEAAKTKLNGYKRSIENLTKQQKIQERELAKIASESGKSSEAYKRQQVRVNQTATSVAKLNSKVKSAQSEVNKLNPHGFNKLAKGAKRVTTTADKMKSGLKGAWEHIKTGATAAAAGIGAVGAAALSGAKKAGNLQQTYKEITNLAVTGGEKQKEATKAVIDMQRQGRDMSIKYGKSQQSIAEAYEELIKRGYTTKQALGAMRTELQGSVASGDDFKDVVSVSSTVLESFGMRAKSTAAMTSNTKRAVNELAYAADMTSTGFKDLGYGMSYVGSSAHQAGFSLSETASAMGILSNNGLEASKAGTGLNQVINRLSDATGKLVKGDKKNVLAKLGISPKEITNSKGQLKSLSTVFGVLNKHMKGMTKVQKINIMKSLFGVNGEQAGLILAKYNKQLGSLSKNVLKAGKNGKYVSDLAAKNSQTAKMQMARLKQAGDAFTMALGAKMLPAINEAGNSLVVFLTKSKDGKRLTSDFAKAVEGLATGLANTIKWIAHHRPETKLIAEGLGAAYGVVKLASLVQWLNKTRLAMKDLSVVTKGLNLTKGLFGKGNGGGKLNGLLQSAHSVGGFKKLSTAGKIGTVAAGAGVAVDAATSIVKAIKDKAGSRKQYEDIGTGAGKAIGGGIGLYFGGPLGAAVGAKIGGVVGKWGGDAVKSFQNGWKKKKPPKKFWSLENLGWSAHSMWNGFTKSVDKTIKWFKKNWKEVGLYFVSPLAGAINSLYKHNKGFHKWVNGLVKGFKKAWKGVGKWFGNIGKNIQKSWKGMTKWFSKLGKNMAKGLKSSWKSMTKWFSNIGKGIKHAWHSMISWFTKLGRGMSKGLKATWHTVVKFFSGIVKGIKGVWHGITGWFGKLGSGAVKGFKSAWHGITDWFRGIISGIKSAWDGFWDKVSGPVKWLNKVFSGKAKIGKIHFAEGTDWRKRYGVPAVVNDAPGKNYREGLLVNGQVIPFPDKRNIPFWLMPGQDIVNGNDMAKMFGHAVHYANGTVKLHGFNDHSLRNLLVKSNQLSDKFLTIAKAEVKKRDKRHQEAKDRHKNKDNLSARDREKATERAKKDHDQLKRLGDRISAALKKKDGNEAKRLTREFNQLTKKYSADKKASKKPDPHAGKVLVDQGLLIGAKSRIGHSVYISKDLFKKLIANLKKKTTTRKRTTHKRRSISRGSSTRRVSTPRVSGSHVSVRATVSGGTAVKGLASAINSIKSKSVKISVKASSSNISSIAKALKKIKGGTHKVTVKTSGVKSLKSLYKYTKKIKGKTHKVKVKTSGVKSLRSLQKNITSVHKRIDSLTKASKKDKFGKDISKQAVEAVKSLKGNGNFAKQFASMTKKFIKDLKTMTKNSKKEFKSMWSQIQHNSKTGENRLIHELGSFTKKYKHDWSSLESGVHKAFSHFWTEMKNSAGKGVNKVIRILNSAIGKIDSVIADFGGSKFAVHKSSLVHYATGTDSNGRLTHDTLAIVNDAKQGPRQEAIVTDTNDVILPKGTDVPVMLKKGWGVLNGTQTQSLGLPHYANGTGLKKLYEIAKHNWNHPVKTGQSMFGAIHNLSGAMKELAQGMKSKSEKSGVNWWSQLWKMVEDKVDDGDLGPASGLLKAVEELGRNKHYSQSKRMSKFFADCSSLVSRAIKAFYHKNWATPNGWALTVAGLWQHAHRIPRSEAKPGDPVFWLPDTHVGVYAGHGKYYSAYGPNDGGPVGMQSVGPGATFGRFNGLNTEGNGSKNVKVKANNALQRQIRKQVGKGFWRIIQKIANKYGDNGLAAAFKLGGDVAQRVKALAKGLKQADPRATKHGIAAIIGNAITESTLNPGIVNGIGAAGLWQFYQNRRTGLNSYANRHHVSWKNPATQINYALNADSSRDLFRSILEGHSSVASLAYRFSKLWEVGGHDAQHVQGALEAAKILGYANGGIASRPSIFGEAGPEMAIPLIPSKSTRAWELIGKAISILTANSSFNAQSQQNDEKEKKEERDFRKSVLLILQEIASKSDVAKITLTTPAGRALWTVVQPFAKEENKREITRLRRGLSGR